MKRLLLDFVVLGELCNFRCPYCTSRKEGSSLGDRPVERVRENLRAALDPLADRFLIYRFGGGELFLAEPIIAWLVDRRFPHTQFLTNGTILPDTLLDTFREARDRVTLCVSLDGHTVAMNRMRQAPGGMKASTLESILENILRLLQAGVPVEIQTVLSEANCDSLASWLDFLLGHFPTAGLMNSIFPVRPLPGAMDRTALRSVVENYDRYREILPSRDYMEGLLRAVSERRRERCRVPDHLSFRVLDLAWEPKAVLRPYFCECGGLRRFYGPVCATCYTHYDLYNSILAGRTDPEAVPFPPFGRREIREYLHRHAGPAPRRRSSDLIGWAAARLLGNHF